MKVKSESEVTQSCPTPSDPLDCSLPGSSVHGIFQARVLECPNPNPNPSRSIYLKSHRTSIPQDPCWETPINLTRMCAQKSAPAHMPLNAEHFRAPLSFCVYISSYSRSPISLLPFFFFPPPFWFRSHGFLAMGCNPHHHEPDI